MTFEEICLLFLSAGHCVSCRGSGETVERSSQINGLRRGEGRILRTASLLRCAGQPQGGKAEPVRFRLEFPDGCTTAAVVWKPRPAQPTVFDAYQRISKADTGFLEINVSASTGDLLGVFVLDAPNDNESCVALDASDACEWIDAGPVTVNCTFLPETNDSFPLSNVTLLSDVIEHKRSSPRFLKWKTGEKVLFQ